MKKFSPPEMKEVSFPTPYTLHPTPHTLHPTPYTLHPTPLKQDLVSVISRQTHERYRE
ncbi:MAG: hypothetical protein GPI95_10090 [Microcystis aeruginosa LG13-11]|nr:hypothetical protein [Microcystis aeruginosa LG13-11]